MNEKIKGTSLPSIPAGIKQYFVPGMYIKRNKEIRKATKQSNRKSWKVKGRDTKTWRGTACQVRLGSADIGYRVWWIYSKYIPLYQSNFYPRTLYFPCPAAGRLFPILLYAVWHTKSQHVTKGANANPGRAPWRALALRGHKIWGKTTRNHSDLIDSSRTTETPNVKDVSLMLSDLVSCVNTPSLKLSTVAATARQHAFIKFPFLLRARIAHFLCARECGPWLLSSY